ncbi:zinc finger protein 277-like isoform X2 [Ptychodera flava]
MMSGDVDAKQDHATCLLCEKNFNVTEQQNDFLKHLFTNHKLVIADVKLVCDLKKYIEYWRKRFQQQPITDFCCVIITNSKPTDIGPREKYFLLSDNLPEDKQIREFLQRKRLDKVLECQQNERTDSSFSRQCLFCRQQFKGNRADVLNHMAHDHSFSVGQPDNLVYTSEFLDILEEKLKSLQCLYCEKTFKDWTTLKDHMRKKQHKRINPKNEVYDKFYVINYLELGKNWESVQAEEDYDAMTPESLSDKEEEWADWDESVGAVAYCLFCDYNSTMIGSLQRHMTDGHGFDLKGIATTLGLNFYQQVKLINYIRRQVYQKTCPYCQEKFEKKDDLSSHLVSKDHTELPSMDTWDQPQYYFPTYENDTLLSLLTDVNDAEDEPGMSCIVVPEDVPRVDGSILQDRNVRRQISGDERLS